MLTPATLAPVKNQVTAQFAARLSQLCDEKRLPERGRQTQLAKVMEVTPNAARKWLLGEGMPELDMAIKLAQWGDVNVLWLLQGTGPKRTPFADVKALVLDEALHAMPREASHQVLEYLRYALERSMPKAQEQVARYTVMIDAMLRDIDKTPA